MIWLSCDRDRKTDHERFSLGAIQVLFLPTDQQELFVGHGLIPRIDFQYHFFNPGYRDRDEFDARFHPSGATFLKRERSAPEARESNPHAAGQNSFAQIRFTYAKLAYALHRLDGGQAGVGRRWLNEAFMCSSFRRCFHRLELVIAQSQGDIIAARSTSLPQRRLI